MDITKFESETRPGCTARTVNPLGNVQTVHVVGTFPMPGQVDQDVGFIEVISARGDEMGAYGMIMRVGGRIEAVGIFAQSPLSKAFVSGLAQLDETNLNRSMSRGGVLR